MKRLHLFEFEDLSWFPNFIRTGGTDYLRYFLIRTGLYLPTVPLLYDALKSTDETKIIDLCSGGGGAVEQLYEELNGLEKDVFTITLTDKFPNTEAFEMIAERNTGNIGYCVESVDVFQVPKKLIGFRVLYSAVHHFKPEQVQLILKDAVAANAPIAFFDGGETKPIAMLGLFIIHPIAFLLCSPFFKPLSFIRLLFTYIIPLIPLYTIWDGLVSILRMYEPAELREMAEKLNAKDYVWKHGKTKNRFGIKATYLIGYPQN
jgi:hypothetical protein